MGLSCEFFRRREPLNIEIIGAEVLETKYAGALEKMVEILRRLKHCYADKYCDFVKVEIVYGKARYEIHWFRSFLIML